MEQSDRAADDRPMLTVVVRSFPESNGRRNWTAMFKRTTAFNGLRGNCGGITIAHSEQWNRVAYAAECARVLLGERQTEPYILDYGTDVSTPQEWTGTDPEGIFWKDVPLDPPGSSRGAQIDRFYEAMRTAYGVTINNSLLSKDIACQEDDDGKIVSVVVSYVEHGVDKVVHITDRYFLHAHIDEKGRYVFQKENGDVELVLTALSITPTAFCPTA